MVTRQAGETVTEEQLAALPLSNYLRMNIRVLDADDEVIAEGRDLIAVRRELRSGGEPAAPARAAARSRKPLLSNIANGISATCPRASTSSAIDCASVCTPRFACAARVSRSSKRAARSKRMRSRAEA